MVDAGDEPMIDAETDGGIAALEASLVAWVVARTESGATVDVATISAASGASASALAKPGGGAELAGLFDDDDGLDFLTEVAADIAADPFADVRPLAVVAGPRDGPAPRPLRAEHWQALERNKALRRCDPTVGALLLDCLALSPAAPIAEGGVVAGLVVAALRSEDGEFVVRALAEAQRRQLATLQVEIAAVLRRHASLGHDGVELALSALDALADGRVVREMEAVLAEHGPALSRHHAWRARHIVQRIRRAGRR
jgi:hypothetical protein